MNNNEEIKLALSHYQSGNLSRAEVLFKEILREQPENTEILYILGIIYAQLEKYELSMRCAEKLLEINNRNAEAYLLIGSLFNHKRLFKKAASCHKRALELDPNLKETIANYFIGNIIKDFMEIVIS